MKLAHEHYINMESRIFILLVRCTYVAYKKRVRYTFIRNSGCKKHIFLLPMGFV